MYVNVRVPSDRCIYWDRTYHALCFHGYQKGQLLLQKKHEASPVIEKRVNTLSGQWRELLHATENRGKGLEEAKDILLFNEEVKKVEMWIREKVSLE